MARKKPKGYYRRGDRWQVDTSYKGIRIRELVATPEMAEKVIRNEQTEIDKECHFGIKRQPKIRLKDFAERYLRWCETQGQKAIRDKRSRIAAVVEHFGPDTPLSDIDLQAVERFKEQRISLRGKRKKRISPATVNRELANIKHLFSKAVEWSLLAENPAYRVKLLPVRNHRLRYLSGDELSRLIEAAPAYLKPIIVVAVNTGLRRGELLRLRWKDIHWSRAQLEILDQKNGEHSYLPLNRAALQALRGIPRRIGSPYVFAKVNGQPPVDFGRKFREAVKGAKIPYFRFHDLRHTFASHLAMSGVDLLTIKELMRHKTMAMTLRYAHLSSQHTKKAVEQLSFETDQKKQEKAL